MGSITESEREVLTQLKKNLSDLDLNNDKVFQDMQLIRWLRARDMDLTKAELMLRNHLVWRREYNIDNILSKCIPESLRAEFPYEIVGFDKEGNVLVNCPYGKLDLKHGIRTRGMDESKAVAHFYFEEVMQVALNNSDGNVMKRFSIIVDVKGLTYSQFASTEVLEYLFENLQAFEQNYPETLGTAFVINAPMVWSILWSMAKPFLHQRTQDKVVIVGSDPKKIKETMLNYVDVEECPENYGGKKKLKYPEPVLIVDENDNNGDPQKEPLNTNTSSFLNMFSRR